MIRSMEGFTLASALDLNMGYYHIKLDANAQKDMYDCISDVFQNVMSKLVQDMEFVETNMLS
jgi:hypothetical protein